MKRVVITVALSLLATMSAMAQEVSSTNNEPTTTEECTCDSRSGDHECSIHINEWNRKQIAEDGVDTNYEGWSSNRSILISWISILASLVTILGLGALLRDIINRRTSRSCQKMIIVDLIRHFIINLAIIEGVKARMENNLRPEEGTFSRFAVLDSDIELGRLSISASNYDAIHEVSLYMRNFNIMAAVTERHFNEASYIKNNKDLEADLGNLKSRMLGCIKRLWIMQIRLGYGIMEERVAKHYMDSYAKYSDIDLDKYSKLSSVVVPLCWDKKELKEFMDNHKAYNRFVSGDILRSCGNIISLIYRSLVAPFEWLLRGFKRSTWYEYGSHLRKPSGWRIDGYKERFETAYKQSIVARMEDIRFNEVSTQKDRSLL